MSDVEADRGGGVEKGSLVHEAVAAVTEHIRAHGLKVGATLPGENHFANSLGVSRAVMREAFGKLAALRVIDVANGRKPKVGAIDGSVIGSALDHAVLTDQISVPDVWDVRRTIEIRTVALAAQRRTDAEAARIVELAQAMGAAADLTAVTRFDIAFHQAIAKASHNALFEQIVRSFSSLMLVAVPTAWNTRVTDEDRREVLSRHLAVAHAIRDRDPRGAVRAMDDHFDSAVASGLEGVVRRNPTDAS